MPRRGIAVAVIVIVACLVALALTSDLLVDRAWFSAIGHLDVFQTILGGKVVLFFAFFAGSAILLWVNGSLASKFARRWRIRHTGGCSRAMSRRSSTLVSEMFWNCTMRMCDFAGAVCRATSVEADTAVCALI